MRNPFHILATNIIRWKDHLPGNSDKLSRELMELGGGRKNCVETYYVRKIEVFLEIAVLCLGVMIAVLVYEHQQDRRVQNGVLERPGYGEGSREQNLILTIGPKNDKVTGSAQDTITGGGQSSSISEGKALSDASQDTTAGAGQLSSISENKVPSDTSQGKSSAQQQSVPSASSTADKNTYESESFDVRLDARSYTSTQVNAILENAVSRLEEGLRGENKTLDEVRYPLSLPASLEDGAVSVEYYITPGGMIEEDGSICGEPEDDGTLVRISATLTCQDKTSTYECAARIYPPLLTPEEQFRENIKDAVEQARSSDPSDPKVKLPDSVDGRTLRWSYPKDSSLTLIILFMLILPIAYWAREDSKIHDTAKERLSQLELDYSQLLWKLTMLLSAGLTIRGAFTRITEQYMSEQAEEESRSGAYIGRHSNWSTGKRDHAAKQTNRSIGKRNHAAKRGKRSSKPAARRYVYEEMILTLREMRSGVPEASAYENFGRRCSLPSYIKLGSLLSQNLKKGSKGLTALLEHEAVLSMDQHKMAVRKLGERASVKMLLPMILMFGVVLLVLMVPAFLSM